MWSANSMLVRINPLNYEQLSLHNMVGVFIYKNADKGDTRAPGRGSALVSVWRSEVVHHNHFIMTKRMVVSYDINPG